MTESRPRRLRSIASRVALVAVLSAALGGLAAALVAIASVDRLLAQQAEQRLRAAAVTLAGELDEDPPKKRSAELLSTLADENDEIVTSGIRLAVFDGQKLLAGDEWLRATPAGACQTWHAASGRVRACSRAYHGWTLVAAQPTDEIRLRWFYVAAALGAVLLGAGAGALSSTRLTRWAIGPLQSLSGALQRSRPERAGELDLGPGSDCLEVESIRTAVIELTRQIQALLQVSERFAADAAHELRTPLTVLRTEIELMVEQAPPSERAVLERIATRLTRLSDLVERLLLLALPTDNLRAGFETVSLAEVAEEAVAALGSAERSRVELRLRSDGLVRGDGELLRSLVANALDNALKFAPHGAASLLLEDRQTNEFGEVCLEILDSGPGIPAALRVRVLEPFFRARPNAARGHGLGLALIGHIARAHGGSAEFLDAAQGARLSVVLPAWQPAPPSAEPAP